MTPSGAVSKSYSKIENKLHLSLVGLGTNPTVPMWCKISLRALYYIFMREKYCLRSEE